MPVPASERAPNAPRAFGRLLRTFIWTALVAALALGCEVVTGLSDFDDKEPSRTIELKDWRLDPSTVDGQADTDVGDCKYWIAGKDNGSGGGVAAHGTIESPGDWSGFSTFEMEVKVDVGSAEFYNFGVHEAARSDYFIDCGTSTTGTDGCPLADVWPCLAQGCVVSRSLFEGDYAMAPEGAAVATNWAFKFAVYAADNFTGSLCIKNLRLK